MCIVKKSSELEGAEITRIPSFEFEKKMMERKPIQSSNENQTQADYVRKGPTANCLSQRADNSKMSNYDSFKGYNSKVPDAILLDSE